MRNWLASLAQPARFARTQQTIHFHKLSRLLCEPLKLSSGGPLTFSTPGPLSYHRVKLQALISRFQKFKNLWSVLCGPLKLLSGGPLSFSTPGPLPYHRVKLQALISKFQKFTKFTNVRKTVPCASPSSYYLMVLSHFILRAPYPIIG